jgi:hypothetical protein
VINSSNRELAAEMLPKMVLGGTAQSNSMKFCAGIEDARLKARRVDGGYLINGVLRASPAKILNLLLHKHFFKPLKFR